MDDYSILCPICIETFRSPRLIKQCGHSFCEQCLFTYVTTLKDKGELGSTFPCPVCRQDVNSPSDTEITLSWIQTFPVDEKLTQKLSSVQTEGESGKESSVVHCDPCTTEHENNKAVKYCVNCQEYLCKDCVGAHRKYKIFHGHSLSDIAESSRSMLTNKMKELVSMKCKKHPDRDVEIYCHCHLVYCCFKCATVTHKECTRLTEIAEMEALANKGIADFYEKFELAEQHIDKLLLLQKKKNPEFVKSKKKITEEMNRLRNQIVSEIDNLIFNFDAQIKQQVIVLNAEADTNIEKMNILKGRCQKNKETIETVKVYGLPAQKVISQTNITKEYYGLEKEITNEEQTIEELEFSFGVLKRLDEYHKELIKSKQEQVKVVRHARDFVRYEDVVNKIRNRNVVRTEKHSIKLVSDCSPIYNAITMIDDKHLLLCDNRDNIYCGHVCLYDIESKAIKKLKMNKPFSAAVLKNKPSHIAVSVQRDKEIHIVSMKGEKLTLEKTFKCAKPPYSIISLDNGLVGVTWDSPPSFDIVDMSGNEMKTVTSFTQDSTGRKFKSFEYVAVDELRSHIVQSCQKDNTVYCFDYSGNPVFEYTDPELISPRGLDIAIDGSIYICSFGNHTLHVLAPSGRKIKVIKDMPKGPLAICFDETGERLWLTHGMYAHAKVFLFSLVV